MKTRIPDTHEAENLFRSNVYRYSVNMCQPQVFLGLFICVGRNDCQTVSKLDRKYHEGMLGAKEQT